MSRALTTVHKPLLRDAVEQALTNNPISNEQEQTLLWLVWLSLASVKDLARCQKKDEKTIWSYLNQLEERDLVAHVRITEQGWPLRHYRYYVTDLGLYVLVARQPHPLSVPKLVQSYPVTRADLQTRLASSIVHLTLSDLASRLCAECPSRYQLISYQQPWHQSYKSLDRKGHMFTCDAALLLLAPSGDQHACYIRVDQAERLLSRKAERRFLSHLFALRQTFALEGTPLPHLLILSTPARFSFWSALLEELPLLYATTPLPGAIIDVSQIRKGVDRPLWLPFRDLMYLSNTATKHTVQWENCLVPLQAVLDTPATPEVIERFSQYFTFKHLLTRQTSTLRSQRVRQLPRYVGDALQEEAVNLFTQPPPLVARIIAEAFHQQKREHIQIAALLSLTLTDQQKGILAWLSRHPYLSEYDLLTLQHPGSIDLRLLRRHLEPLIDMELVQCFLWSMAPTRQDYRRYHLTEQGMRYLSTRHQLAPAYYLYPVIEQQPQDRHTISPLTDTIHWTQRGANLLREQLYHTSGLYHCVRSIVAVAHQSGKYTISYWKSAREAIRWYHNPLTSKIAYARPDAELLYQLPGGSLPQPFFIEYDRGTTFFREYAAKFEAYADYQHETSSALPPILVIMKQPKAFNLIKEAINEVGAKHLRIEFAWEQDVRQHGLLPLLPLLL